MTRKLGISTQFKMANILRARAERYKGSKEPYDVSQGTTLDNIANDIMANDLDSARLRFDSLHTNIRNSLPFDLLDYIDKAEHHVG